MSAVVTRVEQPQLRLPEELLLKIFCHVTYHTNPFDQSAPVRLSHVCVAWRRLALSTSSLWRRIERASPALVRVFLRRSGAAPLDIAHHRHPVTSERRSISLATRYSDHAARWRSLTWKDESSCSAHSVGQLLNTPSSFPLLTDLTVESSVTVLPSSMALTRCQAFEGPSRFPALRSLSLRNVHPLVLWPGGTPCLRRLSLRSIEGLRLSQLYTLLSNAPLKQVAFELTAPVVDLRFSKTSVMGGPIDLSSNTAPPMTLPVNSLTWIPAPYSDLWRILHFFRMPRLQRLTLGVRVSRSTSRLLHVIDQNTFYAGGADDTLTGIPSGSSISLDSLCHLDIMYCGLHNAHMPPPTLSRLYFPALRALALGSLLSDQHAAPPPLPPFTALFEEQPLSRLTELVLRNFALIPHTTRSVLARCPALALLVLRKCTGSGALICALAPGTCEDGHRDWGRGDGAPALCPQLNALDIDGSEDLTIGCIRRVIFARTNGEQAHPSPHSVQESRNVLGDVTNAAGARPLSPVSQGIRGAHKPRHEALRRIKQLRFRSCAGIRREDALGLRDLCGGPETVLWS
ncbi:hypothetical protein C8Q74DRAFT_142562 [Fomes fomentarius]|nr:hypothetical protein C8Q74DRAFT_142562 [Fomes fomentarius]